MQVNIHTSEILEYVRNMENCKIEITQDGEAYVLPINTSLVNKPALVQEFEAYDYQECYNEQEYLFWLEDCYRDFELNGISLKLCA